MNTSNSNTSNNSNSNSNDMMLFKFQSHYIDGVFYVDVDSLKGDKILTGVRIKEGEKSLNDHIQAILDLHSQHEFARWIDKQLPGKAPAILVLAGPKE